MKNAFILFAYIFLSSFTNTFQTEKLPNGHYWAKLDEKYKEQGLVDFDFTVEDKKFTMKIANQYQPLEIKWLDGKTFLVKGFTESTNPNDIEKSFSEDDKIYFRIAKIDDEEYYFVLSSKNDESPIFAGKFIKTE